MNEPFLSADLEERTHGEGGSEFLWHADAVERLRKQLGFANDFYFPLLSVEQFLRNAEQAQKEPTDGAG